MCVGVGEGVKDVRAVCVYACVDVQSLETAVGYLCSLLTPPSQALRGLRCVRWVTVRVSTWS